jgi:hypothetical protein
MRSAKDPFRLICHAWPDQIKIILVIPGRPGPIALGSDNDEARNP